MPYADDCLQEATESICLVYTTVSRADGVVLSGELCCQIGNRATYSTQIPGNWISRRQIFPTKSFIAAVAVADVAAARRNIERVRSGMQIFEASAKIGTGVPEVFQCCAIGSPILARATTFAIEASH